MPGVDLLADLEARGLLQDTTDLDALADRLAEGPTGLYCGFDPTADSLHVGNLIGLLVLRRFQDAGHRPIALLGGATGMIGDPSGKSEERNLLDDARLDENRALIRPQLERFLRFEGVANPARLVDNRDWTGEVRLLDFLRDPGKHVTINQMMGKESVRARMGEGDGISYTEFSYMLLQANDFAHLAEHEDCDLQIGGADQWGNIALGVDLTRRRLGRRVHGLTWPLLLKADGSKYGKTAGGETMWLGAHRMSPYEFFQGWIQVDDGDVRRLLLQLTFLPVAECEEIAARHAEAPERREGQLVLAREVTALVHGEEATAAAEQASAILFGAADPAGASASVLAVLAGAVPTTELSGEELVTGDVADLLCRTGLAKSRGEGRRLVDQGGIALNGVVADADTTLRMDNLLPGGYLLLRKGKRTWHVVVAGQEKSRGVS
jgi:tyrosyl-tRNA synthetase